MKFWNKFKRIIKRLQQKQIRNGLIEIESPQPYDFIGAKFTICGWVGLSLFDTEYGRPDWRVSVDYLALDVKTFMGTSPSPALDDTKMNGDKVYFSIPCELTWVNIGFIKESHGRITIKIESLNKNIEPIYLPLIVKQFEDIHTADPNIIAFVAGDYGMQSFVYDFHVHNSRLKGNGVNQGRGLGVIRDFGKLICGDRFEISTERGFLYRGFFKLEHIQR